jgi:hypothetical protein
LGDFPGAETVSPQLRRVDFQAYAELRGKHT